MIGSALHYNQEVGPVPQDGKADEEPGVAFGGACGLATAFGRSDEGHARWQRSIDGRRVQFHSGAVRVVSYAFTGRIRRAMATDGG